MTRDESLKMRGEVFDAALRVERARLLMESLNKQHGQARIEYNDATIALSSTRSKADAAEASAVQEAAKDGKVAEMAAAVEEVSR
jgi:Ca2+-binding RTX toxin-like protein